MPKERNIIQEVLSLFQQLERERQQHQQRINEIDRALAQVRGGASIASSVPASTKVSGHPVAVRSKGGRKPGKGGNTMSLRQRMAEVSRQQPLSVREIVNAVRKAGHQFESSDPIKSVGSYLYGPEGKKHFKRVDGKFSPLATDAAPSAKAGTSKPAKAKRTMSPEARKRIAEAVRARWARQKAGK
ncbi:MAG TPA: hypothetical protein VK530_03570 [Candidatus Acidoferrum sp.]|nr:hypothetical protein [Candidatus Acidoferrum sp.]